MKTLVSFTLLSTATLFYAVGQSDPDSLRLTANVDVVSNYVFRGTKFGSGPAMQPSLSLNYANLKIGAWGLYCFTSNEAAESDIFLSYTLFDKIKIGVTDYYFPGNDYFDYSDTSGSHAFELNFGLVLNSFSRLRRFRIVNY